MGYIFIIWHAVILINKQGSSLMNFIPAKELKESFDVYGHFYNLRLSNSIFKCRSILEIKRKKTEDKIADIIVIMINPGSSAPLNKLYAPLTYSPKQYFKLKQKEVIATKPDNAQYQIMRLMEKNKWNFVRIINLSDLRNGNSNKFKSEFKNAAEIDQNHPHCITHEERKKELFTAINSKSNKVIAAWGNIAELHDSANKLLRMNLEIIGLRKAHKHEYRYASPYLKKQKIEWLTEIQKQIEKSD